MMLGRYPYDLIVNNKLIEIRPLTVLHHSIVAQNRL